MKPRYSRPYARGRSHEVENPLACSLGVREHGSLGFQGFVLLDSLPGGSSHELLHRLGDSQAN